MKDKAECVFIRKEYFEERSSYIKMLDTGNSEKQSKRAYLFLRIVYEGNSFFIPLRKNLGKSERKFGKIGFELPTETRPLAGLDYRYMLIEKEAKAYIQGFIKKARKDRVHRTAKYRESSLVNFYSELQI